MTLTLPSIVSSAYVGTKADFRTAKVDRSGANRTEYFTATIPAITVITTVIGLVPVQKGARFCHGASQFYVDDLDSSTNVTFDLGYTYYDSAVGTSDDNAIASALTTAQTGGLITFDEPLGMDHVFLGDAWITMTITGGSTTTQGVIKGQVVIAYDTAG